MLVHHPDGAQRLCAEHERAGVRPRHTILQEVGVADALERHGRSWVRVPSLTTMAEPTITGRGDRSNRAIWANSLPGNQ